MHETVYDRENAVNYALKYALEPNESYPHYEADCTNYISQCIVAGRIPMHFGQRGTHDCWFYQSQLLRSSSWAGAKFFNWYLQSKQCRIDWNFTNWFHVEPGDIVQLIKDGEAYHSLIVTEIVDGGNGRSDVLFCSHTLNRKNASLRDTYPMVEKEFYHIIGTV